MVLMSVEEDVRGGVGVVVVTSSRFGEVEK